MKFKPEELRKYELSTEGEKLTYLCVMLEKIVDGFGHPKVIVAGDLIDQPPWTKEYARLREENARLREQLRWHSVDELPRKESSTSFLSVDVFLNISGQGTYKAYYKHWNNTWVDRRNNKIIDVPTNKNARWCYIPDDNQGTDCTQEGE